jgi:hypothetical protein
MHGLINRAFQGFLIDTYGQHVWQETLERADLGLREFETFAEYPDGLLTETIGAAAQVLARESSELAEDAGTYLVTHPNTSSVRRLLRFSGANFTEFLHSLDDLCDRARLAVPGLELPRIVLTEPSPNSFILHCEAKGYPAGHVIIGVLRAMADDYGALALLDFQDRTEDWETIAIAVHDASFAAGRAFDLAGPGVVQ